MSTNFLYAQAPNRKGNVSKHTPGEGGVTSITGGSGGLSQPSGNQGKPSISSSTTSGRGQKVMVSMPKAYDCCSTNTGYLKNSSYTK